VRQNLTARRAIRIERQAHIAAPGRPQHVLLLPLRRLEMESLRPRPVLRPPLRKAKNVSASHNEGRCGKAKPGACPSHRTLFEKNFSTPSPNEGSISEFECTTVGNVVIPVVLSVVPSASGASIVDRIVVYCPSHKVLIRNVEPSTGNGQLRKFHETFTFCSL
jgi:hypothetical protein